LVGDPPEGAPIGGWHFTFYICIFCIDTGGWLVLLRGSFSIWFRGIGRLARNPAGGTPIGGYLMCLGTGDCHLVFAFFIFIFLLIIGDMALVH
jgi:hypothetical protein